MYATDLYNANPPILHRKELLLSPGDPRISEFAQLSVAEEAAGLLDSTSTIGFRLNWERLLTSRGFTTDGHSLSRGGVMHESHAFAGTAIFRHKTALVRHALSRPVKTLLEHKQLWTGTTFFDYGCGLGSDVRGLLDSVLQRPDGTRFTLRVLRGTLPKL